MHDGVDVVFGKDAVQQRGIACFAHDQFAAGNGFPEPGAQVVERDHGFAGRPELPYDVAADVTGSAGNQYFFAFHAEK
jgi:hypothetical protein